MSDGCWLLMVVTTSDIRSFAKGDEVVDVERFCLILLVDVVVELAVDVVMFVLLGVFVVVLAIVFVVVEDRISKKIW